MVMTGAHLQCSAPEICCDPPQGRPGPSWGTATLEDDLGGGPHHILGGHFCGLHPACPKAARGHQSIPHTCTSHTQHRRGGEGFWVGQSAKPWAHGVSAMLLQHAHTQPPPPRPQGSPQSSHRNALWVEEPTRSRASGAANIAGSPHCPPKTQLLPHQGPVTPLCPTPRVGEPPGREAGGFAAGMAMEAMAGTGGGRGWQRNRLHWHQFGRDGPEGNINPPTCPRQPAPPLPAPCQAAPGPRLPLAGQGPRQGHGTGDTGVG